MPTPDLWTIVTSASVGALVSAGLTFLNSHFERRARRDELLLSKAIDLAQQRVNLAVEISKRTGVKIHDAGWMAETYFRWLKHLIRYDELPPDCEA